MRHLRIVENDAVLELARVAHRDAVADNDVLTHVTAAADLAVLADPCGAFQDRALFDNRTAADKNIVADERFADQLAEHRRFQTKLQIARNLFERVPDVILVLEQFRMRSVFEAQIIGRREHLLAPKMIKALVLGECKFATASQIQSLVRLVSFWPSLVSRTSQPSAAIWSRSSSLLAKFFSSRARARSSASLDTSGGMTSGILFSKSSTRLMRSHQCSQLAAVFTSSWPISIARLVSRIVSNRNPSAEEMFRSSSSASSKRDDVPSPACCRTRASPSGRGEGEGSAC